MSFSSFDIFILIIIGLSSFFALLKGFTKSLLSVLNLLLSAIITYLVYPFIEPIGNYWISNSLIAKPVTAIGAYFLSLLVLSFFTSRINEWTKTFQGGGLDRILGVIFGFLRGYIIGFIIYFMIISVSNIFYSDTKQDLGPEWLQKSFSHNLFQPILKYLKPATKIQKQQKPSEIARRAAIELIASLKNKLPQEIMKTSNQEDLKDIENNPDKTVNGSFIKSLIALYRNAVKTGQLKSDPLIENKIKAFEKFIE